MTRIRFEDLPSTNTPRNAENLNKLNNVVISATEPTTGEEVWIDNANKKIYTKNDNGVYEEFDNNKIYITTGEEVATNEYDEGDRVYVKRVDCGYLSSGTITIPHNISNIKNLVRYTGKYVNENSGSLYNIPRSYPTDPSVYNVDCDVNKTNITITSGTAYNGATFKAYIDVYYTKN